MKQTVNATGTSGLNLPDSDSEPASWSNNSNNDTE